ncbi:MAG: dephospho-CoA kinase [Deltaproteobacteria bacterium]|nr:dephospho-CoA kinase [Deltaproteobacteria bacterium]
MIVGLTGGIGTGKSLVGGMLAELGALVIDTDKVGHDVYAAGSEGWRRLVETFGTAIVAPDGTIDRKRLGAIVFGDAERRRALNAIVHPRIFQEIQRAIADRRAAGFTGHVVLEAPVLLEARGTGLVDRVWVVTAPRAAIHERLAGSRDLTAAEVEARMAAQLADAERRAHADLIIENDGDVAALRRRVEAAWRTLDAPAPGA